MVSLGHEPFREFRSQLAQRDDDALEFAAELAGVLPTGHATGVAKTLLGSARNLGQDGQDFLRLASVLAVAPIPASLVAAVFQKADGLAAADASRRQARAFDQVTKASLGKVAGDEGSLRAVHALVSRAMRFRDAEPKRTRALRDSAVVVLTREVAAVAKNPGFHDRVKIDMAHARELVSRMESVSEATLADWVARYDLERAAYASAQALLTREIEFRRHIQGAEHPDTLTSMNNLAGTLSAQGDLRGRASCRKKRWRFAAGF